MFGGSSLLFCDASFFCTPNIYFTKPMMKQMKDPKRQEENKPQQLRPIADTQETAHI
jgi:hypothetical protein